MSAQPQTPFSMPLNWNAAGGETIGDNTPIPEGWYPASITAMEYKPKKDNPQSGYIELTVTLTDPAYPGRQFYDNLMLWDNQNDKIVEITKKKVNTLCHATEQMQLTDLNQLIAKPFYVKLGTQEAREVLDPNTGETKSYPPRNQIKTYKSVAAHQQSGGTGSEIPANFGQGQSPAAAPPAGNFAPPTQAPAPAQTGAPNLAVVQNAPAPAAPAAASGAMPPWVKQ